MTMYLNCFVTNNMPSGTKSITKYQSESRQTAKRFSFFFILVQTG